MNSRDDLIKKIGNDNKPASRVDEVIAHPSLLSALFDRAIRGQGSDRLSAMKTLRLVSETHPKLVYSYFDMVTSLLRSDNSFIKWDAIRILANLAQCDKEGKFACIFDEYFLLIHDSHMITAANVVINAVKIMKAYPLLEDDITEKMFEVPSIVYLKDGKPSPECSNIIIGHVIEAFEAWFPWSKRKPDIISFVSQQSNNTRKSVAAKAQRFLNKHLCAPGDER